MDDLKQRNEIDKTLRGVAARRDGLLRTAPVLSRKRRAVLARFLSVEFPVDGALREAATKRDQSLNPHPPKIPASVELALHQQLRLAEAARLGALHRRASDWQVSGRRAWLRILRSPVGVGLTGIAVITAVVLCFGEWGAPARRNVAENVPHTATVSLESALTLDHPSTSRAESFGRRITIGPFNLNTSEPASLEASFASNRRIQFTDGIETPLGLRLDLPIRATLMEDGLSRTP